MSFIEREKMERVFLQELTTLMYPSDLLHAFGVNGKISGSIGAVGEMAGVLALLHGPKGCAWHYRYSARRRHRPLYGIQSSDLTEEEIIRGGEAKLEAEVRKAYAAFRPSLILIIPTPVSDILNEDAQAVARRLREREGIPVAAVGSELFSHRDKSYAQDRLKKLAQLKITGDQKLELELRGCGFTEALYALVEQVMEPCPPLPASVNIETVGWGEEGIRALPEIEAFLNRAGITVNCRIPSCSVGELRLAPQASLNLVKRLRWARRMKERFGTEYLHIGNAGRYAGLEGICTFYRDVAQALGRGEAMEPLVIRARSRALEQTRDARELLSRHRCLLVCRGLQAAPKEVRRFAVDYGFTVGAVCVLVTPEMRKNLAITDELMEQLIQRAREAIGLFCPGASLLVNPGEEALGEAVRDLQLIVGSDDVSLHRLGLPLLPACSDKLSLSFESYLRAVLRIARRVEDLKPLPDLLLGRLGFSSRWFPLLDSRENLAAKEMWSRMWLNRKEERS
ncbi:MAG: nitrogenase component 1 [Peptococcaceae bacterium]|nr:nitrogenase component 1 [Peptococcaceae bacterium]